MIKFSHLVFGRNLSHLLLLHLMIPKTFKHIYLNERLESQPTLLHLRLMLLQNHPLACLFMILGSCQICGHKNHTIGSCWSHLMENVLLMLNIPSTAHVAASSPFHDLQWCYKPCDLKPKQP